MLEYSNEEKSRRAFLVSGLSVLVASAFLQGCGGGSGETMHGQPVPEIAPAPAPEELQHADLVFNGVNWTDRNGNVIDLQAHLASTLEQPHKHILQTYVYIWQPGWGWHWFYAAYDTGHPFGMFTNPQPHLNFDRYYKWSDLQADINGTTNKRTSYDGHFTVYRKGAAYCAYYYVSIDKVFHDTGDKYNACTSNGTPGWAAGIAAVILFGRSLAPALEPIFIDIVNNLPNFA